MHGFMIITAITILALVGSTPNANACKPVSPGSSVMDCRTDVQIEQAREARIQAQKDEEARVAGAATAEARRNRFKSTKSVEGPAWWQSVRVWLANHNILTAQN